MIGDIEEEPGRSRRNGQLAREMGLSFLEEWRLELAGEVAEPTGHNLPQILSRAQVGALTAGRDMAALALQTLYSGALSPEQLLRLRPRDLEGLAVDPSTLASLGQLASQAGSEHPLFGVNTVQLQSWLDEAALRAQLQLPRALTLRSLRHACACHLLENGLDFVALHRMLGHQNLGVTRQLLHTAVALRGAAYSRSHPLMQRLPARSGWRRADVFLDEDPEDDGEDEPEDRVATPTVAEVGQILAAASSLRDACLLRLYYATGMRRNEVIEARYCDIVPEEQRIFVRRGKSDKDRYVLVDALTLEMLRRWRPDWPPHAPLFGLKESRIGEIFRTCADRCGVRAHYARLGQKLTLHSLRHAFASHCYANGMQMQTLKLLLGHARLSTTVGYVDCSWEQCQAGYASCYP